MTAVSACSQAVARISLDALTATFNGGTIKIFTGALPANTEAPDTGTLLSNGMVCGSPAFAPSLACDSPRGAIATANPVTPDNSAVAGGTAGYWRVYNSEGACLMQGNCTKLGSTASMILNTTTIILGATIGVTSWTILQPNGS